jgi:hypothetical protein
MPVLGRSLGAPARLATCGLILLAALLAFAAAPAVSHADACTPPVTNPVACENTKAGADPSQWQVDGNGDAGLQGYSTAQSVNVGGTIDFKIKSDTSAYHIDIYRLGYYGGLGARLIQGGLTPTSTAAQPACQTFQATGLVDCGNWSVSRSWTVPSTAVSGVYIAVLKRNNPPAGEDGYSQIEFVVRDDSSHSDLVYQTSDETWQAYNDYGGASLYTCTTFCPPGNPKAYQGAFKVSYNRPLTTEVVSDGSSLFHGAEYPMIRFLEQAGYNVSYLSGVDSNSRGSLLLNHKVFISSGHDEYVSQQQRTNIEAARDAGVNLAFFSGNEMFWRTRFEPSQAGTTTADRTLVAYKDTHFDAATDPVTWTGTWRDRRFSSVNTPENALTGQSFVVNAGTSRITVPYAYRLLRLWRNTAATSLAPGGTLQLAPDTLGYEWDVDPDNGFRPAGSFRLNSTTVGGLDSFIDYGSTLAFNTTQTHTMTEYKAPSGALVFGAGTVQWAWGLSDWNNRTPDRNMQQATMNLFADMGAQPTTLVNGTVATSKTTDTTKPVATINTLPSTVADGSTVNITGTATDVGGQVGGVEVSTDGGTTWHPATGTNSWSYSWTAHGAPSATIKVRATDDSGNIQTPGAGTVVNISCPCTMFANSVPPIVDSNDNTPVEVGVKFQSDTYGVVTGVRFYKASTNTGTHTGSLWAADGTRLAQATFTGETASGWQTVTFDQPVAILPNTTYVASYHAPNGRYSAAQDFFWRAPAPGPNGGANTDAPPLHALHNTETTSNGVFSYGSASTFPTQSFGAGNYYVDVMFTRIAAPGAVSNVTASARGLTSATVTWSAPTTGGAPTSYKITPYVGTTAKTPTTITGTPPVTTATVAGLTTGTTYTFTVQAINPNGNGPESAKSNAVTPLTAVAPSVPRNVVAQPASRSASVTWTAPDADGDSAITGYTVTPYIGTTAQTPVQAGASATSAMVTGLNNNTAYTFRVTATNGVGTSVPGISSSVTPEATIFDWSTPATVDSGDVDPVELGVKFKADSNGQVTGIRFYKAATNTGQHIGSLWTTTGTRLATATFTNESASGWQTVTFASPVAITAGTTYIASYFTPTGHYSVNANGGLTNAVDNPPLHTIADTVSSNGVYAYGSGSQFPVNTYHAANYWVDVLYALPLPGQATGVTATAGNRSASVTWTAPSGGGPVTGYKITPYIGSTAQTPTTVNGTGTSANVDSLTSGTAYTFTVQATNDSGSGPASPNSNSVTPTAAVAPSAPTGVLARPGTSSAQVSWTDPTNDSGSAITGHTITPYIGAAAQTPVQVGASATSATVSGLTNGSSYTFVVTRTNGVGTSPASAASDPITPRATIFDFATPTTVDSGDTSPVELGVKFKSDVDGSVTGIRFYKAATNTGAHIGSLWTTGGSRLAQATFTGESASGWQTVTFATPVAITAGTTYVASYFAPNGHYSHTSGGLASGKDNGVLHALADGTVNNGVYSYGGVSTFPTSSFNAADYGVDVLFASNPVPGGVSNVSATAGSRSAVVSWNAPTSGGDPTSYKVTPYIGSSAQSSTTVSAPATNVTVTGLTAGTAYTFTVTPRNGGGDGPESAKSNSVTPTSSSAPGAPTGVAAEPASSSAQVRWTAPPESGSPVTGYTITPYIGTSAQTTASASGSATSATVTGLTNGTAYTFKVNATNAIGTGPDSSASSAVTPRATLLDFGTPATVDGQDSSGIALGVKFTADVDGVVTGLRFYKASTNTGTHVGSLYSSGGSLLGQATFTGESASGWQSVLFATPVAVTAGTTYVASYHAPNGHYSVTGAAFATGGIDNGPLHALSDLASANGVYAYSGTPVFPSSNFNATNYWVDVLFAPGSGT